MIVLSHRGLWRDPDEKNSLMAFRRTVDERFGTETDVRDHGGRLVVSHDPAGADAIALPDVIDIFEGAGLPLAVNIKADGLSDLLASAFRDRSVDWFAFDMSGPETVRYARAGLPFFTRHSDIEPTPVLYEQADGVWLDGFDGIWFDFGVVEKHLSRGKRVCIVSPELHGRNPETLWPMIKDWGGAGPSLMLCTDLPQQANEYFQS